MPHILIIDDDATVRGVVADYLVAAGCVISQANNGTDGLAQAAGEVDLIVLDLMLPGIDGLEVFRRLRRGGSDTPVIMLTAKTGEADRLLGLELGADDYLAKPFSPRELVLRVQAVLRRSQTTTTASDARAVVIDGDLSVDLTARRVTRAGRDLVLTLREFDLLAHLVTHPETVFTREQLMAAVWGWEHGDASTVTVHVRRLREKIECDPASPTRLVTVWGRGYRWDAA